jgi:two-component system, OmpR family, phosphate regulon sensor histidine kinase PhoR
MNTSKWLYPIVILVFSIIALVASLILYIYWYLEVSDGLKSVAKRFSLNPQQFLEPQTWVVILVLSILVGVIFICISIIFVYSQKNLALYRMQHNFINNFTHELKTPVTSLKLYLETFERHELSREEQLKYIGFMIQDAGRLSDNISQILNLAKIEGKSYAKDFSVLDLVQTVEEFLKINKHLFQDCTISIDNPNSGTYLYNINVSLFEMLLMNLLTNALKYNESDRPTINILFRSLEKEMHIRFEDNGIGIDQKEIRKIFKKFYQVGSPNNRTAKGSGIGLYMAEHIAKVHKGKLKAESRGKGFGTSFSLILPHRPASGI